MRGGEISRREQEQGTGDASGVRFPSTVPVDIFRVLDRLRGLAINPNQHQKPKPNKTTQTILLTYQVFSKTKQRNRMTQHRCVQQGTGMKKARQTITSHDALGERGSSLQCMFCDCPPAALCEHNLLHLIPHPFLQELPVEPRVVVRNGFHGLQAHTMTKHPHQQQQEGEPKQRKHVGRPFMGED